MGDIGFMRIDIIQVASIKRNGLLYIYVSMYPVGMNMMKSVHASKSTYVWMFNLYRAFSDFSTGNHLQSPFWGWACCKQKSLRQMNLRINSLRVLYGFKMFYLFLIFLDDSTIPKKFCCFHYRLRKAGVIAISMEIGSNKKGMVS